jgi:NADH:ubiquinone oxidoreductase subunit F (NADH-binding)
MTAVATTRLLLTGDDPAYAAHLARHGAMPRLGPGELARRAKAANLRGRGGAGFPAWRKLAGTPTGATVMANAVEGEPASAKDRTLLEAAPHRVLDGLVAAGAATAASRLVVVAAGAAVEAARRAVAERPEPIDVVEAPRRYVAGQETAVVSMARGGAPLPTSRGRWGLVANVETLAHLGLLARDPEAFAGVGDPAEPGTRLHTVSVAGRPGGRVVEVPTGTPYPQVVALAGLEPGAALLVGGFHGSWAADAPPGAGVLIVLPHGACGLRAVAELLTYLAGESAGQCGPCVNGLPALAESFGRVVAGQSAGKPVGRVHQLADLVEGRGGCHHPDGTARLVRSTLVRFAQDVAAHRDHGCTARALA